MKRAKNASSGCRWKFEIPYGRSYFTKN